MLFKVFVHALPVSFSVTRFGVHIIHDSPLHELMRMAPVSGITQLSEELKQKFEQVNHRTLKISEDSLILEIWGHYYFEKVFNKFRWIFSFSVFDRLVKRLDQSLEEFDCGESGHDPNRWIWDFLSFFKPFFLIFIKDKI